MKGPDGYSEADWLALSGIQHFSFCKRQWALIHIEQLWSENIRMTKPWRKCHYGQLKESCVSRIRVLRLLLWGAAANWAFLWHSIHREVIITVPC